MAARIGRQDARIEELEAQFEAQRAEAGLWKWLERIFRLIGTIGVLCGIPAAIYHFIQLRNEGGGPPANSGDATETSEVADTPTKSRPKTPSGSAKAAKSKSPAPTQTETPRPAPSP